MNWITEENKPLINEVLDSLSDYEAYVRAFTHGSGHKSPEGKRLNESFRKLVEKVNNG